MGWVCIGLIDSPRNPLLQSTKERTTSISTIIHIIDEMFLTNNDIITLDWIENEYCQTGRSKWDGILLKVDNKKVSMGLVEFSGGVKINATANKERSDISKLYANMLTIANGIPVDVPKRVFCARFYAVFISRNSSFTKANVRFSDTDIKVINKDKKMNKEYCKYNSKYIRRIHSGFKIPTSVRLVVEYVVQIPKLLE
ncbi:hypothetical protein K501DRAFT_278751 [Backusella circina FSU 941]|nr:hypothetical protein K501DRAFT_278751 [Backusella circina FSU 941]